MRLPASGAARGLLASSMIAATMAACGLDLRGLDEPMLDARPAPPVEGDGDPADAGDPDGPSVPGDPPTSGDAGQDAGADAAEPEPGPGSTHALAFDDGGYVDMGPLTIPNDFTLEAWVRPRALGAEQVIIGKDKSEQSKGQFRLGIVAQGQPFFTMTDSASKDEGLYDKGYALRAADPLVEGKWAHLAVSKDDKDFKLFVNGALAAAVTTNKGLTHGAPGLAFRVGARVAKGSNAADSAFTGDVDEVRLWMGARPPAAIAAAHATPIAPGDLAFAQLAASYRFEEGAGTTAANAKGDFPGTLVGAATWITTTPF